MEKVILLLDDDPVDIGLLKEAFLEYNDSFEVNLITHTEPENISSLLEEQKPDILLLDLNMPRKSGKEVISEIRASERFSLLPIIVYSTSSSQFDIKECYKRGANWFMVKPSSFRELSAMVNLLCNWIQTASFPKID